MTNISFPTPWIFFWKSLNPEFLKISFELGNSLHKAAIVLRIFAISDIHIDYMENRTWLLDLSKFDYQNDILILAGDVTDKTPLMTMAFEVLKGIFAEVLYVPGNHDLWIRRNNGGDSLERFDLINTLADDHGIRTKPFSCGALTIVPLLSWYDFSFGPPSAQLKRAWMDFRACKWPDGFDEDRINRHFLALNESFLNVENQSVISFSHFLPRIDAMPSFIPDYRRMIYPVLGTALLEKQIRRLKPQIHIYGHTHVNRRVEIDNTTYINNAYGYPQETLITRKELLCVSEV